MPRIPPFRLRAEPLTQDGQVSQGFKWAAAEVGERRRLGGDPEWQQEDETPACRQCGQKMTFYGQLDSIGDDFVLADCGLVYVFVCFEDFEAAAVVQSM